MAIMTEGAQKALLQKFENHGLTAEAAANCTLAAVVYNAIFEEVVHETDAAATLTCAVVAALAAEYGR